MKRLKAFTLAEVMIAMTVLGVLIAMVLPVIMDSMPNQNKMMVKKAFYVTENTVQDLINDSNLYPDNSSFCNTKYDESGTAIPGTGITNTDCYFGFDDINKVDNNGETYEGASKFAKLFREKLNYKKQIAETPDVDYKFSTNDGMDWDLTGTRTVWARNTKPANNIRTITVDVNGRKEPNCLQTACKNPNNFDRFRIDIRSDGKMEVNAADKNAAEYVTVGSKIQE